MTDWTELSQVPVKYNKNLSKNPITESFSYKGVGYQITSTGANISSGYEYPKQIDCSVGGDAGCQF
jgi:hypothetical protein